jgi:arylsulfatase A-like enzyme
MGNAFFRWDGFKHYASFSEFLPGLSLIIILWTLIAVLASVFIWLFSKLIISISARMGLKVTTERILLFICILFYLLLAIWKIKPFVQPVPGVALHIKLLLFFCASLVAIFITWLLNKKVNNWINTLQEHISPLVWLFGICFLFSIPILTYHTLIKKADDVIPATMPSSFEKTNIILVTFDALAARDMSVYGYHRETTPFIKKWAENSSLFTRLEAASNLTMPTTTTLMTSKRLWTHQTYHQQGSRPDKRETENLPLVLLKNGYYTMAFVQNYNASVRTLGIVSSFNYAPRASVFWEPITLLGHIDKFLFRLFAHKIRLYDWIIKPDFIFLELINILSQDPTETEAPAENMFKSFLSAVDNISQRPYFAWIHILPPHEPYLPPRAYRGIFKYSTGPFQTNSDRKRTKYDEFIRYCDDQFEYFINELSKKDILKNTIIILSADHGESFEHGYFSHGGKHLYEDVTHIPLIIKTPGQTEGKIIDTIIGQASIAPTILNLAQIPVPSWMEGRSLVPLLNNKQIPERPVFSMNLEENFSLGHAINHGTIAAWEGEYKLINYLGENKNLLFNLKQDPQELINLFDQEPQISQHLLTLINKDLAKVNKKITAKD